jgi:hypothetical protein
MNYALVALSPVAGYGTGDRITDAAVIERIEGTDAERNTVRVALPDEPETIEAVE